MLGERSGQKGLWDADHFSWTPMGRNTSQVLLTSWRDDCSARLFLAQLDCSDDIRIVVPASAMATELLLHAHDKVSDAEAEARPDLNLRWTVAFGIQVEDRPLAKST